MTGGDLHRVAEEAWRKVPRDWPRPRGDKRREGRYEGDARQLRGLLEAAVGRYGPNAWVLLVKAGPAPSNTLSWFAPGVPVMYQGQDRGDGLYKVPAQAALYALDRGLIRCGT
ncbi:hypothetical protein [Deinococcus ficus]|nr:hypothetical protein [Deinococcus ficus]